VGASGRAPVALATEFIMAALWIAQVVIFTAGWLGPWRDVPPRATNGRLPVAIRMLLSLSLVCAALLIRQRGRPEFAAYTHLVFLGMAASFVGDLIMARLLPLPNRLIGGMLAFAAAHALYVSAYVSALHLRGASVDNAGLWLGLALYGACSLGGWWLFIRNPARGTAVNTGALVYGTWIAVMAAFALALAAGLGGAWWIVALGGFLFVASDFLIGITDIRGVRIRNANDWIWLTYVAGQMGIIYAPWVAAG
jgi:hypothetical protein